MTTDQMLRLRTKGTHVMMKNGRREAAGFTLIELMVVTAIIAILAAVAYPSYTEQVARGRRADAKAALLEAAQFMERRYTVGSTYSGATLPLLRGTTGNYYAMGFAGGASAPTAATYWLEINPNAGGPMANDRCGGFYVNQAGARGITGTTGGATAATCWDK